LQKSVTRKKALFLAQVMAFHGEARQKSRFSYTTFSDARRGRTGSYISDAPTSAPSTIAARLRSLGISRRRPLTVTPYLFDWFQYMLLFADCQSFCGGFLGK